MLITILEFNTLMNAFSHQFSEMDYTSVRIIQNKILFYFRNMTNY